jgi:hypothetical protein
LVHDIVRREKFKRFVERRGKIKKEVLIGYYMNRRWYFFICWFLPIILAIGAGIIIWIHLEPYSQEVPFKIYHFDITLDPDSPSYIRNFGLEYDFGEGQGNLSFSLFTPSKIIGRAIIFLPKELEVVNFNVTGEDNTDITPYCYKITGDAAGISCDNILGNKTLNFALKLKSRDFYPNGAFIFNFPSEDTSPSFKMDTLSYDLLRFNLGRYRCSEKCFSDEKLDSNLTTMLDKQSFRVYFIPKTKLSLGSWCGFIISVYDSWDEKVSGFWLALGISFLSGALFFLLNFLRDVLKSISS